MIVIERERNTGKTTILLHYMVCNPNSIYVCYTEKYADLVHIKAQRLGLNLDRLRFKSISDPNIRTCHDHGYKILVDDLNLITRRYPQLGFNLAGMADIATISGSE
jgi:hypothetical protein